MSAQAFQTVVPLGNAFALKPFIALVKTLKSHLANILTYLRITITNAAAEGLNSKV